MPLLNQNANGNAWFVEKIKLVKSADEEIKALDSLDTKKVAVFNEVELFKYTSDFPIHPSPVDSTSYIKLDIYKPNYLKYSSYNSNQGLAIFSEMYYGSGWNAYVDGNKQSVFRANYVLRALQLRPGKHTIEFKFEPEVVKTGSTIALISTILMVLLIGLGLYFDNKRTI
jgi:uncharacterized membrane protein YfhO